MKDKNGKTIKIGDNVQTIDFNDIRMVIEIHEEDDTITTVKNDGTKLRSSKGIEKLGFAVVR